MNFNYIDPEFPDLPWNKEAREAIDNHAFIEWKQAETIKSLQNNSFYKEFEEDNLGTENDIKFFQEYYAKELAWGLSFGPRGDKYFHRNHNKFLYYAEDALCEIQQKKLFDLQCKWRAGQADITGISSTSDFMYWETNIRDAWFLSPISEDELKVYMDYLKSSEYRINWKCFSWQDYTAIKNDYLNNGGRSNIPAWYHYHNYATQNSSLLQLPDIIGGQEKIYLAKYDEYRTETLNKNPSAAIPDNRPRLIADKASIESFLKQFNYSTKVLEQFLGENGETEGTIAWRYYQDAAEYLLDETELIPIEENEDWKEAFLDVVYKYRNKKVAELLPEMFADYLNDQLDEILPNRRVLEDEKEQQARKILAADYLKMIEKGRELSSRG